MANEVMTAVNNVVTELQWAVDNFPPFNSAHEGYAVILEELDELWDEIKDNKADGSHERQLKEAKQVAAMALRFMIDIGAKNYRNEKSHRAEKPKNLRIIRTPVNRWGEGKIHAASYRSDPVWGRNWLPLCRPHTYGTVESVENVAETVTCKWCLRKLGVDKTTKS